MTWEPLRAGGPPVRDLGSVLGKLHTTMGLARPNTVRVLESQWSSLLGPRLAEKCRLESIKGTEMVVSVSDPAVAEHLRWSTQDVIGAVNSVCGGDVVDQLTVKVRRDTA